jgi:polygalacturonase
MPNESLLSRRQCIPLLSTPLLATLVHADGPKPSDDKLLGAKIYNIRDFGAKGDGTTLDTAAVQNAIDQCHKDNGGTVLVPAGTFIVGTLELKSNVTLHLATQGKLLGSEKPEHYKAGRGVPPGNGNIVMFSAAEAENIAIEGNGTIDGNGAKFFTGRGDGTGPGGNPREGYFQRPHLMVFYKCKNLTIRDVFLTASAYHCCRILGCQYVKLDGVRIHNRVNKNNDGFHFNNSEYVNISNCNIACQDDACALFGSNKFVTVTNCSFSTRWSIFRFGGGQCENITISNCIIYDTFGCAIKMRCGARTRFENISFSNLIMKNVTGPISIGLDSTSRRPATAPSAGAPVAAAAAPQRGIIRNISFNGIRATVVATGRQHEDLPFKSDFRPGETRQCIVLNGVGDDMIEGISFTDVHITVEGGGTAEEAANRDVPKKAGEYFEIGTPPAHGLYARNVRNLTLHNVRIQMTNPDLRPAIVFENVEDAAINGLSAQGNPQAESMLRLINSREVLMTGTRILTPAGTFLQVEGDQSQGITVDGGDLSKAAKPVAFAHGAGDTAARFRT